MVIHFSDLTLPFFDSGVMEAALTSSFVPSQEERPFMDPVPESFLSVVAPSPTFRLRLLQQSLYWQEFLDSFIIL